MSKLLEELGSRTRSLFCFQNRGGWKTISMKSGEDPMDVLKMLADLRQERQQIEEAIMTLERLAAGRGRRRGRPPAWMSTVKRRGRPPGSKNKTKEPAAAA